MRVDRRTVVARLSLAASPALARDGSLLVADDQGQTIWKVTYTGKK